MPENCSSNKKETTRGRCIVYRQAVASKAEVPLEKNVRMSSLIGGSLGWDSVHLSPRAHLFA